MAMSELLAARLALGFRARLSSLPLLHRVDRPHGLCGMSSSGVQFVSSSTSAASISRPVCRLSSQSSRVLQFVVDPEGVSSRPPRREQATRPAATVRPLAARPAVGTPGPRSASQAAAWETAARRRGRKKRPAASVGGRGGGGGGGAARERRGVGQRRRAEAAVRGRARGLSSCQSAPARPPCVRGCGCGCGCGCGRVNDTTCTYRGCIDADGFPRHRTLHGRAASKAARRARSARSSFPPTARPSRRPAARPPRPPRGFERSRRTRAHNDYPRRMRPRRGGAAAGPLPR